MCPVFCNTRNGLIKHLFKKHRNEPNFIVHSASEGCGASFRTDDSFRMHCSRKHLAEELNNTNGTVEDDAMRESMDTQSKKFVEVNIISKGKAFMILSLIMSNLPVSENKLLVDITIS
jgi:hypothetical protein